MFSKMLNTIFSKQLFTSVASLARASMMHQSGSSVGSDSVGSSDYVGGGAGTARTAAGPPLKKPTSGDSGGSSSSNVADSAADTKHRRRSCQVPGHARAKRRGGSQAYYDSAASLSPGPGSIAEIAEWPRDLMQRIFAKSTVEGHNLRRQRCMSFFELGEVMHTDFSGFGCPEQSKAILQVCFAEWGFKLPEEWFVSWRAADSSAVCQSVLKGATHTPMHLFGDLTELMLADPHKSEIMGMRAELDDKGKKPIDLMDAQKRHLQMKKYLRRHGRDIHAKKKSSGCLLHPGQECQIAYKPAPVEGQKHSLRPLRTCMAGPMCTPWCTLGTQLAYSHPALESFFVWMEHVVQERYDMTTMENNKWFPKAEYETRMSPLGKVVSIVTSADKLGFPCSRERLFSTPLSYEPWFGLGPAPTRKSMTSSMPCSGGAAKWRQMCMSATARRMPVTTEKNLADEEASLEAQSTTCLSCCRLVVGAGFKLMRT